MKNLILGLALCTVAIACKSNDKAEVTSTEGASAPTPDCCAAGEGEEGCDMGAKADCDGAGCDEAMKEACQEGKVCPMTGKVME